MIDDIRRPNRPAEKSLQPEKEKQTALADANSTIDGIPTTEELNSKVSSATEEAIPVISSPVENTEKTISTEDKIALTPKDDSSGFWRTHKKATVIVIICILVIGIGGGLFALTRPHKKVVAVTKSVQITKPKAIAAAVPTTVPSDLSGLPVSPSVNNGPVTAIMVENSTFARPQSGLSQAGVVFEAIAEGGITRFMALYQDTAPANVGPIRSVRPYYEQWALGFDASLAHVGGSPEALADINTWNVRNLDQFYNGSYYHRITTREAPHNVYTAIATLNQLEDTKGYTSSTYTGFPRKSAAPVKAPTAGTINLTLSNTTYDVNYGYDATTNSYNRSEGGAAQTDANTNAQISPKVVIAMVVPYSLEADGYHSDYSVIGSGDVDVFQDGIVTQGTWSKTSNTSQITFKTINGTVIKLDPGQTWITAVASSGDIGFTP
jgi:hypothetical protein